MNVPARILTIIIMKWIEKGEEITAANLNTLLANSGFKPITSASIKHFDY